jgi:photosynthetic reaction center cytochrome c subunit
VNSQYQDHVANVGVTCYTCHRGQNNPSQVWFSGAAPASGAGLAEVSMGKNLPTANADGSSLPSDPFTPYLLNNQPIRVNANTALPSGDRSSLKETEWTYALMMHYSTALGVGCEFCHNSRAIQDWNQSTPYRVTAWYAEGMLRDLNRNYMVPLTGTFPAALRGPSGDVAKIDCATCHQGVYKPLFGAQMASAFPALEGVGTSAGTTTPPAAVNSGPGPAAPAPPATPTAPGTKG